MQRGGRRLIGNGCDIFLKNNGPFVITDSGSEMALIGSGDGSEVNPESWTQLKGSNET